MSRLYLGSPEHVNPGGQIAILGRQISYGGALHPTLPHDGYMSQGRPSLVLSTIWTLLFSVPFIALYKSVNCLK